MINALFAKKPKSTKEQTLAHDTFFSTLRKREYARLDQQKQVYLDYTGGNLYSAQQLQLHQQLLAKNVFGNPHSTNPSSQLATQLVAQARKKVLSFFNAEDYYCIFTQNASGALKIIGECYPFCENGHFLLFADNHNSVNGIREYCKGKKGDFSYVPIHFEDLMIDGENLSKALESHPNKKHKLLAFPAQSNVSGVKHDLGWIQKAQGKGWDVLLDAAAFAPTSILNLQEVQPDFVSLSFYKIFGYPTGLGCLLVKKDKFSLLKKPWFAGGTVSLVAVKTPSHFLVNDHERFENGTINYLDIPAIKIGLDYIEKIGMQRINERVQSLQDYLVEKLTPLQHTTGIPQVKVYGPKDRKDTGGTLLINFFNPDNTQIPFNIVEEKANQKRISLRSGCFCNPGLDEINSCVSIEETAKYFSSRDDSSETEFTASLKKMRGAVRVSVGLATTKQDLESFLGFVGSLKDTIV
ncbi:aminotransferase class V-fold PLP-dependent enzyme [Marinirhabdus gelatinilytica]|uniref:Selenocysteine lyase/cysteine desulfurase n=1 Tax=Marinirhabdus gelatinilytica TaxID=1703343 RepID=A0A370QJZ3_9FLAO|nr:aminotransferase class V-fold PLP-dependent enzyme [Marinirhabdus gelatinilytica]RDK88380.1 selenocysteine lyase/cysteine desulfurase [Marinirhabdus gelatinilytica]